MTEKVKKESKNTRENKRLIIFLAAVVTIVLVTYGVSIIVGGDFHDFCESAIIWVLAGIGICGYFAYYNQKEK